MSRTVYAAWWGGPNYSTPTVTSLMCIDSPNLEPSDTDVETFSSMAAARLHFALRLNDTSGLFPGVTDAAEMQLWFEDPRRDPDPNPDRRITVGPRGGIRTERR